MGPKHSGGFAVFAAAGMIAITLLITGAALFSGKMDWANVHFGSLHHPPGEMWIAFVSIVLALSGVEAIANLTGVMRRPVSKTATKAIFVVALEVAVFNIVLPHVHDGDFPGLIGKPHVNDMLAFLSAASLRRPLGRVAGTGSSAVCWQLLEPREYRGEWPDEHHVRRQPRRGIAGDFPEGQSIRRAVGRGDSRGQACRISHPVHQPRPGSFGGAVCDRRDRRGRDQCVAVHGASAIAPVVSQGTDGRA